METQYVNRGRYDRRAQKFIGDPAFLRPGVHGYAKRMEQQCAIAFDYEAFTQERGLNPHKPKLTRDELREVIKKRKQKKEMQKKRWLLNLE
jgi:hypothetical protein